MNRTFQSTAPKPFKTPWVWPKGLPSVCSTEHDKGRLCICGSVPLTLSPGATIPNTELMLLAVSTHEC